jgi:predicted Fe-Mo cluster-binding NifX family protein
MKTFNNTGRTQMKIAVTYENGQIFQHFGHSENFKIYSVEEGQVKNSEVVGTNGSGHGALAGVLASMGVTALICGGIGGGARQALDEAGIEIYGGASGSADDAVTALLAGSLQFDPDASCSHHEGGAHNCGGHGHGAEGGCGGHGHGAEGGCGGHGHGGCGGGCR